MKHDHRRIAWCYQCGAWRGPVGWPVDWLEVEQTDRIGWAQPRADQEESEVSHDWILWPRLSSDGTCPWYSMDKAKRRFCVLADHHSGDHAHHVACEQRLEEGSGCIYSRGHQEPHKYAPGLLTCEDDEELVKHPKHYGGDVPHEHVKCMEAIGLVDNAFLYNCTKYIWRVGKKTGADAVVDLKKALWYLQRAVEWEEKR